MKKLSNLKRSALIIFALVLGATMLLMAGCNDKPVETPAASTPEATPGETTPEATTPDPGEEFNISYDLDGGIDGGNPTVYNNANDLKLIIPIKVGSDFIGWTGTGITEPTVSVTVAKGTEGDLSFKANWAENGEFAV